MPDVGKYQTDVAGERLRGSFPVNDLRWSEDGELGGRTRLRRACPERGRRRPFGQQSDAGRKFFVWPIPVAAASAFVAQRRSKNPFGQSRVRYFGRPRGTCWRTGRQE